MSEDEEIGVLFIVIMLALFVVAMGLWGANLPVRLD